MSRLNRFQDELSLIFIYKVVSEVGVFTWNWPEGDLFVFLENNIISTETVKDHVNVTERLQIQCQIDTNP